MGNRREGTPISFRQLESRRRHLLSTSSPDNGVVAQQVSVASVIGNLATTALQRCFLPLYPASPLLDHVQRPPLQPVHCCRPLARPTMTLATHPPSTASPCRCAYRMASLAGSAGASHSRSCELLPANAPSSSAAAVQTLAVVLRSCRCSSDISYKSAERRAAIRTRRLLAAAGPPCAVSQDVHHTYPNELDSCNPGAA